VIYWWPYPWDHEDILTDALKSHILELLESPEYKGNKFSSLTITQIERSFLDQCEGIFPPPPANVRMALLTALDELVYRGVLVCWRGNWKEEEPPTVVPELWPHLYFLKPGVKKDPLGRE
jgi:hypothetical protein